MWAIRQLKFDRNEDDSIYTYTEFIGVTVDRRVAESYERNNFIVIYVKEIDKPYGM